MKTNKLPLSARIGLTITVVCIIWLIITLWVELDGPSKLSHISGHAGAKKVLIVYDPDPIFNLDEQVCLSIAAGLSSNGTDATIATATAVAELQPNMYDAYVLCANTYNWYPDWSMVDLIRIGNFIKNKPVVALVVGSGSTENSMKVFENTIRDMKGNLKQSRSMWLMRPNDEHVQTENNTDVAKAIAEKMGVDFALYLEKI